MKTELLLTIAIPTWNRATYLRTLLTQIQQQRSALAGHPLELLVCDNHSDDDTPDVVTEASQLGYPIRYVRHPENIGSDCNIATCFNLALGRYVWVMGDDDLPVDGTLPWLIELLTTSNHALLYLRPFGFDQNFRAEQPRTRGRDVSTADLGEFLAKIGSQLTLISAMIVNKSLIPELNAREFCGSNLVQVEVYLSAARQLSKYFYSTHYRVAYKRNNFGPYDSSSVFVENLNKILDRHEQRGLPAAALQRLQASMLLRYFPQHALKMRWVRDQYCKPSHVMFRARFGRRPLYWLLVDPIFAAPRPIALMLGIGATALGRSLSGDMGRGCHFFYHRVVSWLHR